MSQPNNVIENLIIWTCQRCGAALITPEWEYDRPLCKSCAEKEVSA